MVYKAIGTSPVDWAGKTYPEIKDLAEQDGSILIVPIGSLEQHGPHLPTITDTVLVDAIAHGGAEAAYDNGIPVLVTPPVWTGESAHHLPFGGTASVQSDTLRTILAEISDSTLENGFDTIFLLNGHGGNISTLGVAVTEIGRDHPDAEIMGMTYWDLARGFVEDIRESDTGGMGHAGEFETSLMLYLRPDLLHEDRVTGTRYEKPYSHEGADMFHPGSLTVYRPFSAYTEAGPAGRPELGTKDKGDELYEKLTDAFHDLLDEIHTTTR